MTCEHSELAWGHCANCGMPLSQQMLEAVEAAEVMAAMSQAMEAMAAKTFRPKP